MRLAMRCHTCHDTVMSHVSTHSTRFYNGHMEYEQRELGVCIVDNDPCALRTMAGIVTDTPHCILLWICESGSVAVHRCAGGRGRKPDVLIVDMSLNDTDGPALCAAIRSVVPDVVCLGVTAYPTARFRERARRCGIMQLIDKQSAHHALPALLTALSRTGQPDRPCQSAHPNHSSQVDQPAHTRHSATPRPLNHAANPADDAGRRDDIAATAIPIPLSPREREIISLYAQGLSTADIAERLRISCPSVYTYQNRAIGKLHARTLAHAVHIATMLGLV